MLLTYLLYRGPARREVFRLSWDRDVQLQAGMIRLTDHKGGGGAQHVRWQKMHPELIKALAWWRDARPCTVDNVFMQTHCDGALGEPFRQRNKFMARLCERAGSTFRLSRAPAQERGDYLRRSRPGRRADSDGAQPGHNDEHLRPQRRSVLRSGVHCDGARREWYRACSKRAAGKIMPHEVRS